MPFSFFLNGARGRMGAAIKATAPAHEAVLAGECDAGDPFPAALNGAEVAIDFSVHGATLNLLETCGPLGVPVVVGTTGHTEEERDGIIAWSRKIPLVWSGNYSVGVNLLFFLTRQTASILGEEFHPEIVETHHQHKVDAPSGTAENLVDQILSARGWDRRTVTKGRAGLTGARPHQQIGVHALRGGAVVGEHTVHFISPHERIELTHRAQDRSIFASGALRAAHWVRTQSPGLYSMQDVLGLK